MWMQKGHRGCTSAGTDACIDGTVKVRVRHVIDRGWRRGTSHKASSERRVFMVQ